MIQPDWVEYDQKLRDLKARIAGRSYLYIDFCDKCDMPIVKSYGSGERSRCCEPCKGEIQVARKWEQKKERSKTL